MTSEAYGRRRILVAVASKHGATRQIADHIAARLRHRSADVAVEDAAVVDDVDGYDAVVIGSAVYAGHWLKEARGVAERVAARDPRPAVWMFSSGPVGDPPKPTEDPVDVAEIVDLTDARGHEIFAGKLDRSALGFGERAIAIAFRAPEGDFRDWHAIAAWADGIADALEAGSESGTIAG